jgi:hypothetical protein
VDSFRIVVTNPDSKKIRFVSWLTNPDSFRIVDHESFMFSKYSFCRLIFKRFACFYESNESLRILSTMAQNESLKIEIRESGFVTPNLKYSFRGFVSCKQKSQITRFVSIRKDSYTNPASLVNSNPQWDSPLPDQTKDRNRKRNETHFLRWGCNKKISIFIINNSANNYNVTLESDWII